MSKPRKLTLDPSQCPEIEFSDPPTLIEIEAWLGLLIQHGEIDCLRDFDTVCMPFDPAAGEDQTAIAIYFEGTLYRDLDETAWCRTVVLDDCDDDACDCCEPCAGKRCHLAAGESFVLQFAGGPEEGLEAKVELTSMLTKQLVDDFEACGDGVPFKTVDKTNQTFPAAFNSDRDCIVSDPIELPAGIYRVMSCVQRHGKDRLLHSRFLFVE